MTPYDRDVLVSVLVYHYRRNDSSCGCGWAELGRSHPEHVANVYEASVTANLNPPDASLHASPEV
jgi:hypothetical protein